GKPLRFVCANSSSCFSLIDWAIWREAPLRLETGRSPRLAGGRNAPRFEPFRARAYSALSALRAIKFGLGLFRASATDALDRAAWHAGLCRDLRVLFFDNGPGRFVAFETAERRARNPAVGSLRAVLVHHVEQDEFANGSRSGFTSHVV